MRRLRKLFTSLLLLSVVVMLLSQTAFAVEEYTYTVRVYAGDPKIGALTGGGVTAKGGSISRSGDCIMVSGLKYGDTVYINAQDAVKAVDERYYVRGVAQAGREESEAAQSTFTVDGNRDFVAAYGIKGDMVAYTVQYVDTAGNALLDSDTYYGNPGERQYVSSRYVDGYLPQAWNLVKTLSANESENVFTFTYTAAAAGTVTTPPAADAGTGTDTAAGGAAGGDGAAGAGAAGDADVEAEADGLVEAPDEEVPQDLVNLDDEEVPLANVKKDRPGTVMSHLPVYIGVGAVALVALIVAAVYLKKRRKR